MTSEPNRIRLELSTSDDKVTKLVEYVNNNQPTPYDYPVPDITVLPVSGGNEKYLEFIYRFRKFVLITLIFIWILDIVISHFIKAPFLV